MYSVGMVVSFFENRIKKRAFERTPAFVILVNRLIVLGVLCP